MTWLVFNYKTNRGMGKVEASSENDALMQVAKERDISDESLDSSGYYVIREDTNTTTGKEQRYDS